MEKERIIASGPDPVETVTVLTLKENPGYLKQKWEPGFLSYYTFR
jgi:hypothetical protein